MMALTKNQVFTGIKEYFLMALGMVLYAFGWIGCILPANGMGGGAAGLSFVLCSALKSQFGVEFQIGTMSFIINGILLLVAGFIVGWKFGIKTVFSITMIAVMMNFWQEYLPMWFPETNGYPFAGMENFLVVIMGGVIAGIGVALCFKQGGSTGGVDIVSMIINKYRTVRYGNVIMVSDFSIIASSMLVGKDISTVIYGFIMTAVFGYTVDMIMSGNQQSNQVFIMSHKHEEIADVIMKTAQRGVTMLDGMGWYTKEHSQVVMVVCRKRETSMIMKAVKTIDPDAFMSVGSVMGVYGKGFQPLMK